MKRVLKYIISLQGYQVCSVRAFPTTATGKEQLARLLHRLHPIGTGKALVRLGPRGDGGYLVPDDLEGIDACFSPGVSNVSGFELDCANLGMAVHLADHSVDQPAESHARFRFMKRFIGATTNETFITLDDWVNDAQVGHESDLMLQIDIEGCEYEVFLSASDALMRRFRIIVAEFHGLDELWNRPFFGVAGRVFDKILQTHACVHLHPNNCCGALIREGIELPRVMEFTFLRSDRIERGAYASTFPHPLDVDSAAGRPTLRLPSCWYRGA